MRGQKILRDAGILRISRFRGRYTRPFLINAFVGGSHKRIVARPPSELDQLQQLRPGTFRSPCLKQKLRSGLSVNLKPKLSTRLRVCIILP